MATAEELKLKVTVDGADKVDKLTKSAESATDKFSRLNNALQIAALVSYSTNVLRLADNIYDLSNGSDISIAKILQLREAFASNGGNAEALGVVIQRLNNTLSDARNGSASAQETLLKLGLTFKDMANMDTADALEATIQKLSKMSDAAERNAMAVQIFGKQAANIDWAGIQNGTTSSIAEFEKYEARIKKAAEAHDKLSIAAENLMIAFSTLLDTSGVLDFINNLDTSIKNLQPVVDLVGGLITLWFGSKAVTAFGNLRKESEMVGTAVDGLTAAFARAGAAFELAFGAGALTTLKNFGVALAAAIYSPDLNANEEQLNKIYKSRETMFNNLPKALKDAYWKMSGEEQARVAEMVSNGKTMEAAISKISGVTLPSKKAVTPAWSGEIAQIDALSAAYENNLYWEAERYKAESDAMLQTESNANKKRILFSMDEKYAQEIFKLNQQITQLQAGPQSAASDAKIAALKKEKTQFEETYDSHREKMIELIDLRNEEQRSFGTGWERAFNKYIDQATNSSILAENIFNSMTGNMNSAIDDFVEKGKFSFKDFSNSIIKDLLKIGLKYQAAQLFNNIGNLGIGGMLSGLFSGRAIGGPVQANEPYVVGERGPELFVPATAGNVVSNNQMSTAGAGGSNIIQYNISAVDAMSFKQMLARDPSFLYAVTEQGRRSLPMTRR